MSHDEQPNRRRYPTGGSVVVATALVALVLALATASGGCRRRAAKPTKDTAPQPAASPTAPQAAAASSLPSRRGPDDYAASFAHGGRQRHYRVHLPPAYDGQTALPVLLMIHGGGGNADSAAPYFGIEQGADREGFIVVYPEGTGRRVRGTLFGSWNAGRCCNPAQADGVNDVGFFGELLDRLGRELRIDERRIYASGMSNGALMAYRLACELTDRIAAIAVAGAHDAIQGACQPTRPIAVLHMHGTEDGCAHYRGGECGGCLADFFRGLGLPVPRYTWTCSSVPDYVASWQRLNGCSGAAKTSYRQGKAECLTHDRCRAGTEVTLCRVEGMGHTWPGRAVHSPEICRKRPDGLLCRRWKRRVGELTQDLDANSTMWRFLRRFRLPAVAEP